MNKNYSLALVFLLAGITVVHGEVHNYRSGISMELSGVEGADYAVETFFHAPEIFDAEVVYIKADTTISFFHNALNVCGKQGTHWFYRTVGVNGVDGIPESGDEGVIRYWVDGDLHWGFRWSRYYNATDRQSQAPPAYQTPLTFASLKYPAPSPVAGTDVLGSTGDNGAPLVPKTGYFTFGLLDEVGDEWHTLTVWDDDSMPGNRPGDAEWWASDGKVRLFVVNPKTPCLTWTTQGDGKFYTTPAKHYNVPKIFEQTTYCEYKTGGFEVTIRDISGNNVFYRVVSDPDSNAEYVDVGSSSVTLNQGYFSDGVQYLQYYYEGRSDHVKTRKVVCNPEHPSKDEAHGLMLWGNPQAKKSWVKDVVTTDSYWWRRYRTGADGGRNTWQTQRNTGQRYMTYFALINALLADRLGPSASQTGQQSYALFAKEMLMQNMHRLDPVGAETQHTQESLPTRELFYRGYFDSDHVFDLAFGYDVLINVFKSSDHPEGITPVEDYYLRDLLGKAVFNVNATNGNIYDPGIAIDSGGMWDVARRCAAVACMFAMPSYDTHYYGKSGLDGATGGYEWAPFRDSRMTWKEIFIDNSSEMVGYPNYSKRLGIEEYNCSQDGKMLDRPVYFGHMGADMTVAATLIGRAFPNKTFPNLEACLVNALKGSLEGMKGNDSPQKYVIVTGYNSVFPNVVVSGIDHVAADPASANQSAANAPFQWGMFEPNMKIASPNGLKITVD